MITVYIQADPQNIRQPNDGSTYKILAMTQGKGKKHTAIPRNQWPPVSVEMTEADGRSIILSVGGDSVAAMENYVARIHRTDSVMLHWAHTHVKDEYAVVVRETGKPYPFYFGKKRGWKGDVIATQTLEETAFTHALMG